MERAQRRKMRRKILIHLSYYTENENEDLADDLYRSFQKQFIEKFPDGKLAGVFISKEDAPANSERKND